MDLRQPQRCFLPFSGEAVLEKVIESLPDGFVLINREGDILVVNRQATELFGYSAEELLGQKIERLIPERFAAEHPGHRNRFFNHPQARGMGKGLPLCGLHRDGREFPVEVSLSPLAIDEEIYAIASIRDVTERKALEKRVNAQAERLRRHGFALRALAESNFHEFNDIKHALTEKTAIALQTARVSVWRFDAERSELSCNALFSIDKTSPKPASSLKKDKFPYYFKEISDNHMVVADDALHHPATRDLAEEYLHPLGITSMLDVGIFSQSELIGIVCAEHVGPQRQWFEEEVSFMQAVSHLAELSIAITERQRVEQALEQHQAHLEKQIEERTSALRAQGETLRSITDSAQHAIIKVKEDGLISFWNDAATRIFGWGPQEAIGRKVYDLFVPEEYAEQFRKVFQPGKRTATEEQTGANFELEALRKDGERLSIELATSTIARGNEWHTVSIIADITQRKATEAQLFRQMAEMERFSKLAVDRERVMIELKREINDLLKQSGQKEKYRIVT